MDLDKLPSIIDEIRNNFPKVESFILAFILLILFFNLIEDLLSHFGIVLFIQAIIFDIFSLTLLISWLKSRRSLPKNKKNKIGIILSIETENNNQKIRYRNDLIKRIEKLAIEENKLNIFEIITPSDFQSKRISDALKKYSHQRRINAAEDELNKSEFTKIQKKIQGHLYIWGDIKERKDGKEKYIIEIEALVLHHPIKIEASKALARDISAAWLNTIKFQTIDELVGFSVSADLIFFSAKYIIGLALYVSGDISSALDIHKNCRTEIDKKRVKPPNLINIKNSLDTLITNETIFNSVLNYKKGNIFEAKESINNLLKEQPNSYEANVAKSLFEFQDNNIEEAFKAIIKAEKIIGSKKGAGTYKYNKAFLLMVKGEHKVAFRIYQSISKTMYLGEKRDLREVMIFLEGIVKSHKELLEAYFVLGYLEYKKNNNYPSAYTNFKTFIDKTKNIEKYSYLTVRASTYLAEVSKKMNITTNEDNELI